MCLASAAMTKEAHSVQSVLVGLVLLQQPTLMRSLVQ